MHFLPRVISVLFLLIEHTGKVFNVKPLDIPYIDPLEGVLRTITLRTLDINDNIDDDMDRLNARLELFFEEFQCYFDDFDCTHFK